MTDRKGIGQQTYPARRLIACDDAVILPPGRRRQVGILLRTTFLVVQAGSW